jgi:hypothetical protein
MRPKPIFAPGQTRETAPGKCSEEPSPILSEISLGGPAKSESSHAIPSTLSSIETGICLKLGHSRAKNPLVIGLTAAETSAPDGKDDYRLRRCWGFGWIITGFPA